MLAFGNVTRVRAAIYCRISDDRAGAGLGVARQEDDCRALVKQRGWTLADTYTDNDISAYSGKPRPGYLRMMADVEAGTIDVVVAWHPDRLHRSPRELEDFIDLLERTGATVATVQAGTYDLSTPTGRMTARIVGATARHESEHKSERQRRKALEIAQAGGQSGGWTRPFGFEADRITVNEDEADEIRWAVAEVLAGRSLRSVVIDFDARGVLTTMGNRWQQMTLRRVLTSYRIAGVRSLKGQPIADAKWPAIIDRATLERVRAILLNPNRRTTQVTSRRYPLRQVLRCSTCDLPMWGRPREDGARRYICPPGPPAYGCGRVILAGTLEDYVRDTIAVTVDAQRLAKLREIAEGTDAQREALFRQLHDDEQALADAYTDFRVDRAITAAQYSQAQQTLQARIDDVRRRLSAVFPALVADTPSTPEGFVSAWDDGDAQRRAALAGLFVEQVAIGPAKRGLNRFDPGRVTIRWRE